MTRPLYFLALILALGTLFGGFILWTQKQDRECVGKAFPADWTHEYWCK